MYLKIKTLPVSFLIKPDIALFENPLKTFFFPSFSIVSSFFEVELAKF